MPQVGKLLIANDSLTGGANSNWRDNLKDFGNSVQDEVLEIH